MTLSNSIFTYFCYALAISAITVICSSVDINGGGSTNLIALGTVDGKTFFADDTRGNWTKARTFCSTMGMRLATITSKAQWNLLISAHNETTFNGGFWTAARDSQTPRQFTWDGLDSQPSETFGTWVNPNNMPYLTCGAFIPHPDYRTMYLYQCDYTNFKANRCAYFERDRLLFKLGSEVLLPNKDTKDCRRILKWMDKNGFNPDKPVSYPPQFMRI